MKDLKIFTLFSSTFSDVSMELNNYAVDQVAYSMIEDADYIFIGLYKNFKNIFVETVSQAIAGEISYEYYDGATWQELKVVDESKDFSRPGFISWSQELFPTSINGQELYYVRITGDITGVLAGINMVFANDNDLSERYRDIAQYMGNDSSFIAYHQAAKKDMIQDIKNSGQTKVSSINGSLTDLTVWDFLRPEQVRVAAAYLCLSKIFAGVSDNSEGKFFTLSEGYEKDYSKALETFLLTIDRKDTGTEDLEDQNSSVKLCKVIQV